MLMLLMLVMLGVFIHSSQAVKCYNCINCDEPTGATCNGEVCVKGITKARGEFMIDGAISQLPKLCVKISILMHRRMWVRFFSTRLTSVTFAEDKVLIFLILRKNAKIVQL